MGIIRSGIVLILGSILFLTLFMGNTFLTLSWSLEYDNVQEQMGAISVQAFESFGFRDVIDENYDVMLLFCQTNPSFEYNTEEFSISVPCEVINTGIDNVIEYGAEQIIEDLYYREYNCSFFSCLKEDNGMYVLISEKAYDYWNSKFYLITVLSIILFVLMFFAATKKNLPFIIAGILTIVSAIPFKKLDWILRLVPTGDMGEIALAFFTKSYNVFLIMLVIGIGLLIFGVGFTFLGIGVKASKMIDKLVPEKRKKKGEVPLTDDQTVGRSDSQKREEEKREKTFTKEEVKEIVKEEVAKTKKKEKVKKEIKEGKASSSNNGN